MSENEIKNKLKNLYKLVDDFKINKDTVELTSGMNGYPEPYQGFGIEVQNFKNAEKFMNEFNKLLSLIDDDLSELEDEYDELPEAIEDLRENVNEIEKATYIQPHFKPGQTYFNFHELILVDITTNQTFYEIYELEKLSDLCEAMIEGHPKLFNDPFGEFRKYEIDLSEDEEEERWPADIAERILNEIKEGERKNIEVEKEYMAIPHDIDEREAHNDGIVGYPEKHMLDNFINQEVFAYRDRNGNYHEIQPYVWISGMSEDLSDKLYSHGGIVSQEEAGKAKLK